MKQLGSFLAVLVVIWFADQLGYLLSLHQNRATGVELVRAMFWPVSFVEAIKLYAVAALAIRAFR
jgi:hypothetical protein